MRKHEFFYYKPFYKERSDNMKMNYWTDSETKILLDNYNKCSKEEMMNLLPNRSWSAILSKANKKSIQKRFLWTQEEDDILIEQYPKIPIDDFLKLLPNRTRDSIISRAMKLGVNCYDRHFWSEKEEQYIKDNWETMPDIIIANNLGKSKESVKNKRNLLGLHRQNRNHKSYDNISKYLRGQIYQWKKESMKQCNYKCVLTSSKEFEIHHIYPVNMIIEDMIDNYNISILPLDKYTSDDLIYLTKLFVEEHKKHPLGECIRKDIHTLFHSLYGQYNTTEKQWIQFKKDYNNGLYNKK